jgi:hypothetical protein
MTPEHIKTLQAMAAAELILIGDIESRVARASLNGCKRQIPTMRAEAQSRQEKVDALRSAPALVEERDVLKAQVEFLEWMRDNIPSHNGIWLKERVYDGVKDFSIRDSEGGCIASWPGELRDGWQHFAAIQAAVK